MERKVRVLKQSGLGIFVTWQVCFQLIHFS
jgi:hypothetical protein